MSGASKEWHQVYNKAYHEAHKEEIRLRARRNTLKRVFGLTEDQYDALLLNQKGCCGVCRRSAESFPRRLAVDHDHKTGQIRGLLCTHCNRYVIGRHREPELFENAAEYLRTPTEWFVPPKQKKKRKSRGKNPSNRTR